MSNKKIHPEDYDMAKAINDAVYFKAFYRKGPFEKYTSGQLESYEMARAKADELAAKNPCQGKKGLVYAITKNNMSINCTPELIALAATL